MNVPVLIGCPVHNRDWILKEYLEAVRALDYPKKYIHLEFIVNDSQDNTLAMLEEFEWLHKKDYASIFIREINFEEGRRDRRYAKVRQRSHVFLKQLRRLMLMDFLNGDCKYFFAVDSDILITPDSLMHLMTHDKDAVAGLVLNGWLKRNDFNFLFYHHKQFKRDKKFKIPAKLFEVGLTGAAILLSRKAAEVILADQQVSVDDFDRVMAFNLKDAGIPMYVDGALKFEHKMRAQDG